MVHTCKYVILQIVCHFTSYFMPITSEILYYILRYGASVKKP